MSFTNEDRTDIVALSVGVWGAAPGYDNINSLAADFQNGATLEDIVDGLATTDVFAMVRPASETDQEFADDFASHLVGGHVTEQQEADVAAIVLDIFEANLNAGMDRQQAKARTMMEGIQVARTIEDGPFADAAQALRNKIEVAEYYSVELQKNGSLPELQAVIAGVDETEASVEAAKERAENEGSQTFNLTEETAAGADVARLTGDMDVRFDITSNDGQVRGLDLDGDGTIAADGVENNNPTDLDDGKDFEILDAYSRNKLNESDIANNFLGDIDFDGTGFDGDGVNTDGNIFLGGLGADTALGGIGNDFMVGGGVAAGRWAAGLAEWIANGGNPEDFDFDDIHDTLHGGRNADFFFGELSLLDNTDGNSLFINGGSTSDDAAAGNNTPQDSDWLLLEVSDDEDGTVVNLGGFGENNQSVTTGAGRSISMSEIEHFDGSGNLYGFVDDVDVALGGNGQVVDGENVGIGSSAQLIIHGSVADNILIGGFDNDLIRGEDGDDLLMGGRLDYNNNPNLTGIMNDGMDELYGEDGNDNIVMELDGGIIDGGEDTDTLWLTEMTFGTQSADEMTEDGVVRIDLGNENSEYQGYGGSDTSGTHDQTNYVQSEYRVDANNMENVIATGLGGLDYLAAGSNDPELLFNNQQNIGGIDSDLDLRGADGEDGDNILYANTGDDVIEGRGGDDRLSGGEGNDDFIFSLGAVGEDNVHVGDGVDVIHRQVDADGDNIWDVDADGDVIYGQDFGLDSESAVGTSSLILEVEETNNPGNELQNITVSEITSVIRDSDGDIPFTLDTDAISAATTYDELLTAIQDAIADNPDIADTLTASLQADNTILITDAQGRELETQSPDALFSVSANNLDITVGMTFGEPEITVTEDRLIYRAYEDRADGELVDDDSVTGSFVSLGEDNYAEDLVVNFAEDGTRIAEDQAYTLEFDNLTTQDIVTIRVNGVAFRLQVGVDLDGNTIADEDSSTGTPQEIIQSNFLDRLEGFIDSFMDDDTAAGQVSAGRSGNDTLILTQVDYNGEETVFMTTPEVEIDQLSGGEQADVQVTNNSESEVHLLDFDGRDGNLNDDNVIFDGKSGINRAALQTADNAGDSITGKQAVLIDNASDTHADSVSNTGDSIFDSQATNDNLDGDVDIYSVHGDDLLIGGNGDDVIMGGTGDDRVIGSLGDDELDGGKNYYSVQVLGESEARVYELNVWEAANFSIAGETISSMGLIAQTEDGINDVSGLFDDTLLFQQADFEPGVTEFTITLNDYAVDGGEIELQNDGAGTVDVDVDADGVIDSTTEFTNFENIRTVSGIGNAVAGDGQGNDTLDVGAMSTDAGGISYDLTNSGTQGQVRYSMDAFLTFPGDVPQAGDYESLVLRVDGVENVIGGAGDDLLTIDETEGAKNNEFWGNLGTDRIVYQNSYGNQDAEPTVTIKVNTANDTDEVVMTGGRVGSTVATDTLVGVEHLALQADTAESTRADDVIDVTAMTSGAVVDYTEGEIRDLSDNVQLTIEQMYEMENVWADGDDTVIVADEDVMDQNNQYGNTGSDITFATFMDYDELDGSNQRIAFANQSTGQIEDVWNEDLFTFELSKTGGGNDTDTVDYSQVNDSIATVVQEGDLQHVLVDEDSLGDSFSNGSVTRIDQLIGVERIVASQSESVLDFTNMGQDIEVSFQFDENNADNATDTFENVVRIGDADGNTIQGIPSYVERWDMNNNAAVDPFNSVSWNRIEGGDANETILYDGSEDLVNLAGVDHRYSDDTLNLRGGDNEVAYSEMETSIHATIDVDDVAGTIDATIDFADGNDTYSGGANALAGAGQHTISSHASNNATSAGNLKIAASQDAEDSVEFSNQSSKVYILGTSPGVIDVRIGSLDTMRLTGFEFLEDSDTNDVYDMASLGTVDGSLELTDDAADHDLIKVGNDAADDDYNGGIPGDTTIDLEELNTVFSFDFDALDVTGVTDDDVTTVIGTADVEGSDEVVLGAINNIDTLEEFESVVFTQGAIDENGTLFSLDTNTNTLSAGGRDLDVTNNGATTSLLGTFSADSVISFRGLVLEDAVDGGQVNAVTDGITFSVTGNDDVAALGGDGDDTITGGGGNNIIAGGAGADTLDGGLTPEVQETLIFELSGNLATGGAAGDYVELNDGVNWIRFAQDGSVTGSTSGAIHPAGTTNVTAGSTGTQVGQAFVNFQSDIIAELAAFGIDSITNDAGDITFTYDSGVDPATTDLTIGEVDGSAAGDSDMEAGNTPIVGATVDSAQGDQYAAQVDTDDTFVYVAASDSVEGSMDEVLNFDSGNDSLDFSLIDNSLSGIDTLGSALSDGDAFTNDAAVFFDGDDTYVYVDTDDNGTYEEGSDSLVQLVGVDTTGSDAFAAGVYTA